jgi:hypothetical protein
MPDHDAPSSRALAVRFAGVLAEGHTVENGRDARL